MWLSWISPRRSVQKKCQHGFLNSVQHPKSVKTILVQL